MKSVALPSWHPDAQPVHETEPTDPLQKAEWTITACGGAVMVLVVIALLLFQ